MSTYYMPSEILDRAVTTKRGNTYQFNIRVRFLAQLVKSKPSASRYANLVIRI